MSTRYFSIKIKRYQIILKGVCIFLVLNFIGGLLSVLTPRHEIFTVFSWFLFPITPNPETKFALRLHEVAGKGLEQPSYYEKAEGIVNELRSIKVYQIVQELGKAKEWDYRAEITRIRFMLGKNYVLSPCRYYLLAVTCDPVKRWKTGLMQEETVTTYQAP